VPSMYAAIISSARWPGGGESVIARRRR
jgi:hypothetical protein